MERHSIDLWYVLLDKVTDPQLEAEYRALLSKEETRRHARFIPPQVRHQYLVSHALVRTTLSHYASIDPRQWEFRFSPHGKPSIDSPPGLPWEFNLSHTRGLAVCAVTRDHAVGVDAEIRDEKLDCMGLAKRFFHPAEAAALEDSPEQCRRGVFFQVWTLKEAYLKACGTGLSVALDSFWFSFEPGRPPKFSQSGTSGESAGQWQFGRLQLNGRYEIAVASRLSAGQGLQLRVRETVPLRWQQPWQELAERDSNRWNLA